MTTVATRQHRGWGLPTRHTPRAVDYALAGVVSAFIACLILATTPDLRHWIIIPVTLCGALIGADAVRWARGRLGIFDPVGVVGVVGYHFFFLAPLLHVRWDQWLSFVVGPPDWRPWIGRMALINVVSLVAYRVALGVGTTPSKVPAEPESEWRLAPARFWPAIIFALSLSFLIEVYVLWRVGGPTGFESAVVAGTGLQGLGWMLALGESFPLLCLIAWVVYRHQRRVRTTVTQVAIALCLFAAAQFLLTGLRGSRGNLVWTVFIAVACIHATIRPIRRSALAAMAILAILFMYFYGFYKAGGLDAVREATTSDARARLGEESGRTVPVLLLQDLGRADIQAFLLYRFTSSATTYSPVYGATYVGGLAQLVPGAIWADRPPGKLKTGTDVLYGPGTYDLGRFYAQNIYGLGGETMMNFGVLAVPVAYVLLARVVRRSQRFCNRLRPEDSRRFLTAWVVVLCLLLMTSDIDNVAYTALQFGLLPVSVLVFGSKRVTSLPSPAVPQ